MFLEDLLWLLEKQGVGKENTNMFASSKSAVPAGPGPFLTVSETGGSGPEGTHNAAAEGKVAYERPSAQILCRAASYNVARLMAQKAFNAIVKVGSKSQMVNGTWWRSAAPLQNPFDFGQDGSGRAQVAFNITVVKRPDAAV